MEHERIATNGIHLHVVTDGPAEGPLVILLHGFPEFWYCWRQQIPFLVGEGFRVTTATAGSCTARPSSDAAHRAPVA